MQIKRLFPLKKINIEKITINDLYDRLYSITKERGFKKKILGYVDGWSILIFYRKIDKTKPSILFSSCFHGNEVAGCLGIINFLENAPEDLLNSINVSFMPIVNPTGLELNKRKNKWDENPNRGYCHLSSNKTKISKEGLILESNIALITALAKDCFVSLHEDPDFEYYYLYTYEKETEPSDWSLKLKNTLESIFSPIPKKLANYLFVNMASSIVFKCCDGSFEDLLFHLGIPLTATTETPGQLPLKKRIQANSAIIASVIKYIKKKARL
jgi:predicted deacylase